GEVQVHRPGARRRKRLGLLPGSYLRLQCWTVPQPGPRGHRLRSSHPAVLERIQLRLELAGYQCRLVGDLSRYLGSRRGARISCGLSPDPDALSGVFRGVGFAMPVELGTVV